MGAGRPARAADAQREGGGGEGRAGGGVPGGAWAIQVDPVCICVRGGLNLVCRAQSRAGGRG